MAEGSKQVKPTALARSGIDAGCYRVSVCFLEVLDCLAARPT